MTRQALTLAALLALYLGASATEPRPASSHQTATWCAPTPTHCQNWGGDAHLGAVRSFTFGDRPYRVRVCRTDARACTEVRIVSFCACPGTTAIDLSVAAFQELAPLSLGRVPVSVERVGPSMTLPPTDVAP